MINSMHQLLLLGLVHEKAMIFLNRNFQAWNFFFTNISNRVIINPVQNFVGIVCILHSFTHSRSFRVYNEENSCKHLLNIACRLDE